MLFAQKLSSEVYPPWKEHYIAYEQLKKLLKESVISPNYEWTEEDETRFVESLDKELDKVYGFETHKFEEISAKISKAEEDARKIDVDVKRSKALERELEQILDDATQLDRFRRLNYTGFVKLVRKHDRLHPKYQVMPLLQVRSNALPFHSEDYSPLFRRLSHIYTFLDEQTDDKSAFSRSQKLNSSDKDYHSRGYVTLQYWVHPDNLMEVKTRILRKLPVLVYNREDDDEESDRDPIVTSLYLDNRDFDLYHALLGRPPMEDDNSLSATSLRFRWYGPLYERPEIVLEEHNELNGRITRISMKEKMINKFLAGNEDVIQKQARKMSDRHAPQQQVDDYLSAANELQDLIEEHHLEPMLRTVYKRTAFEIPGDDRVRVILDQDILFVREDVLNQDRPIRDPSSWHRQDLDQPGVKLSSVLRKGEYARFPYSVLEVRLRAGAETGVEKLPWIEELQSSNLIKEVPRFTKFLQGVAVMYGEDDRLDTLPFWLSELGAHREDQGRASSQEDVGKHGHDAPQAGPSRQPPLRIQDYKFDDDDQIFDSEDSGILDPVLDTAEEVEHEEIGFPTRVSKLHDEESDDDEVVLPPGVEEPSKWLKNQASLKIEAKVWLANERTFNKWLNVTCLLSALTFTLYSSVSQSASPEVATTVAYVLFALTLFTGIWGYIQYMMRMKYIRERGDRPMDAPIGPLIVSLGLLFALIVNFGALYKSKVGGHSPATASAMASAAADAVSEALDVRFPYKE